jgi:hypothetical protein
LRGDKDACLKALENARDKVTLPEASDMLNDPDLVSVKEQDWFVEFMETLNKKMEAENKEAAAEKAHEKKWVLVERNAVSEEIITEQDASVEDNAAEEVK